MKTKLNPEVFRQMAIYRKSSKHSIISQSYKDIIDLEKEFDNMNATKKIYDLSSIMVRAWAIRKAAAAEIGCAVSVVVMSECLRLAWAEAEGEHAADNAYNLVNAWGNMSSEGQVEMMQKCIHKAAKNEIKYTTEDHYLQYTEVPAFGLYGQHELDEFVNETWLRVVSSLDVDRLTVRNERRATEGKRPVTLVSYVYNAARASIAAVYYQDIKHERARCVTIISEDGEEYSYFDTMEAAAKDNTERSAILRADLERFTAGRDDIDRKILELLPLGYTERQIGAAVGVSGVAIHKRIVKIRKAIRESGIA